MLETIVDSLPVPFSSPNNPTQNEDPNPLLAKAENDLMNSPTTLHALVSAGEPDVAQRTAVNGSEVGSTATAHVDPPNLPRHFYCPHPAHFPTPDSSTTNHCIAYVSLSGATPL